MVWWMRCSLTWIGWAKAVAGIFWLASYPKSGNTWFRSVLSTCQSGAETPPDINALRTGQIASSRAWLDDVAGFDTADLTQTETANLRPHVYRWSAGNTTDIAYHKIHDAYRMTAEGQPIIDDEATLGAVYIIRNPLDVAPSYAAHNGTDIDRAITLMGDHDHAFARSKTALSAQILQMIGSWSDHVTSWVDAPRLALHVIRYEDMLARPEASFGRALEFLGFAQDANRVARAVDLCRFERMARQEAEHGFRERGVKAEQFFRMGRAGGWRDTLSETQVARIISDHGQVMHRFGYLDAQGHPV